MTLHPRLTLLVPLIAGFAAPLPAQDLVGDAEAGGTAFGRQCVACHVIADPDGQVLAGRSARTGPNLWGVVGRTPGTHPDFDYGESIVAYGATGAVWGLDTLPPYLEDPTGFLREALGDSGARSKMSFKVRNEQAAADIAAYLATFGPAAGAEGAAAPVPE